MSDAVVANAADNWGNLYRRRRSNCVFEKIKNQREDPGYDERSGFGLLPFRFERRIARQWWKSSACRIRKEKLFDPMTMLVLKGVREPCWRRSTCWRRS